MVEAETITKHYFISGRVQGVGFRAFTQRLATDLHLTGWVRNLPDGRVEVMVCGADMALENFEGLLRQGPPQGEVDFVEVHRGAPGEFRDFEIRRDE